MSQLYCPKFLSLTAFLLLSLFFHSHTQAQTNDNINWSSVKLQKNLDAKTSIALAPIFRFNQDISNYQNSSIDYSIKRKIGKIWSAQLLGRTWFIPNGPNRQFIWLDFGFSKKINNSKIGSSLRLHYALDLEGRTDGDFIRWKTTFGLLNNKKIRPQIAVEPWFQINEPNRFQRFRIEPGVVFQLHKQLQLSTIYRREETINTDPSLNFNMYVLTLSYLVP